MQMYSHVCIHAFVHYLYSKGYQVNTKDNELLSSDELEDFIEHWLENSEE